MVTIKEQALQYLAKGFSILPVGKDKRPLLKWEGYQKKQPEAWEVELWFQKWPDANIGIVTGQVSGLVVVDFDTLEAFENAKAKGLPQTPMVKTYKGYHAYFKYREGVRNFQMRDDLPGIDLRGEGGYVVASPSVHGKGQVYSWCAGQSLDDVPLADLPESLLALNEAQKTPLDELEKGVPKGKRNNALARLTGHWLAQGIDLGLCVTKALVWNKKNIPPMPEKEVWDCVHSIGDKHKREKSNSIVNTVPIVIEKKYFTINHLKNLKPINVDWLWEGYLARGYITLLSGWPKAGKTTLLFNLIKAIKKQQPFLDRATKQDGNILIITEENSQYYKARVEEACIDGDDIFILPGFEVECYRKEQVFEQIEIAIKEGVSLIIVDTLGEFWGVNDENSATLVREGLKQFRTIAQKNNVAFLLIHHLRKADGENGTAILGSIAILGAVDIGLEFKYASPNNRRTISSKSRFHQTPPELMIEWDGTNYKSLGDPVHFTKEDVKKRFLEALSQNIHEELGEIIKRMSPKPGDTLLGEIAKEYREQGLVDFIGTGKKGSPYKYKRQV